MKSLFDDATRAALVARLDRLTADTPARWGKFTAPKMVAHLNQSARMAMGSLAVAPRRSFLTNAFMRWLIIYVAPFPKSAPTAPELLSAGHNAEFDAERAEFHELLRKLLARRYEEAWPPHPAFGPMTGKDWGVLGHKHIDHHLRQFGV